MSGGGLGQDPGTGEVRVCTCVIVCTRGSSSGYAIVCVSSLPS